MGKIGIMTFHSAHNCGSMLQAIALQNVLDSKYGIKSELIDFSNLSQKNMYAPFPKMTNFKKVIKNLIWLGVRAKLFKQHAEFEEFKKSYMVLSDESFSSEEELRNYLIDYDKIIAGSDQIWNINCLDADDAYYLNFNDSVRKFGYSLSFGANNPFEVSVAPSKYINWISKFELLSVRENNARKWLMNTMNIDVPITLDPTLLLSKQEWESFVDIGAPIIQGKYIFYYCFSIDNSVKKFLKWLSNKMKMPVYFMDVKEWQLKACWLDGIKLVNSYGPRAYLNLVKNSELFVTTSFHGTAFATIFQKNFWYIDSGKNDLSKDDRAVSFLTQLGLMDRYKTILELKKIDLTVCPDYVRVYEKLNALKDESFTYLDNIMKA